jgi:hypothetical protein
MSFTFREVKAQLGAANVAEIKAILEQISRPITEPISSDDFEILRGLYPLIKQGMSIQEAIAQGAVAEPIAFHEQEPQEPQEAPTYPQPDLIAQATSAIRQEFVASRVEDSLRRDVKNFYLLYFQMWDEALKSPEILNDDEIKNACRGAATSTLEAIQEINSGFLSNFRNRLRMKGFLPSVNQPQLVEAELTQLTD